VQPARAHASRRGWKRPGFRHRCEREHRSETQPSRAGLGDAEDDRRDLDHARLALAEEQPALRRELEIDAEVDGVDDDAERIGDRRP
jgi:hypothetical protein